MACTYGINHNSYKRGSAPSIHVENFTPTITTALRPFLDFELQELLQEVAMLRRETDSFQCSCNSPDCPFTSASKEQQFDEESEKESPDLGFGSMEALNRQSHSLYRDPSKKKVRYSMPQAQTLPLRLESPPPHRHSLPLTHTSSSKSLTNIPRGVQKRADGTILEYDYPGLNGKERKNGMISGFSLSHLNRLGVRFDESLEDDCLVDQDGLTNNEDYVFKREAPERRLRRNWRKSSEVLNLSRQSISSGETNYSYQKRFSTASS